MEQLNLELRQKMELQMKARQILAAALRALRAPVLSHYQRKIHSRGNMWSFTVG